MRLVPPTLPEWVLLFWTSHLSRNTESKGLGLPSRCSRHARPHRQASVQNSSECAAHHVPALMCLWPACVHTARTAVTQPPWPGCCLWSRPGTFEWDALSLEPPTSLDATGSQRLIFHLPCVEFILLTEKQACTPKETLRKWLRPRQPQGLLKASC